MVLSLSGCVHPDYKEDDNQNVIDVEKSYSGDMLEAIEQAIDEILENQE